MRLSGDGFGIAIGTGTAVWTDWDWDYEWCLNRDLDCDWDWDCGWCRYRNWDYGWEWDYGWDRGWDSDRDWNRERNGGMGLGFVLQPLCPKCVVFAFVNFISSLLSLFPLSTLCFGVVLECAFFAVWLVCVCFHVRAVASSAACPRGDLCTAIGTSGRPVGTSRLAVGAGRQEAVGAVGERGNSC